MNAHRQIFEFADIRVDPGKRTVSRSDGEVFQMPSKVFDTLLYLIEHRDAVVTKSELMSAIWPDTAVEENNLNKAISTLRRLLGDTYRDNRYIVTVAGRGYKFVADVFVLTVSEVDHRSSEPVSDADSKFLARPIAIFTIALLALVSAGFYYVNSRAVSPPAQVAGVSGDSEITNPEVYELLLQARHLKEQPRGDDWLKASEYYERAVAAAPNYPRAHAELAGHYMRLANDSFGNPGELVEKAGRSASKAVELDESMPEARLALGEYYLNSWQWADSEREYLRAIQLNPDLARAHAKYAALLSVLQRHDEAIVEARRARELDPLSIPHTLGVGVRLLYARRYDEALNEFERLPGLPENLVQAGELIVFAYAGKGLYKDAIERYEKSQQAAKPSTDSIFIAIIYAKAGNPERARAKLAELESKKDYVSPFELADLYVGLGEYEKAIASLEKAYEQRDLQLKHISYDWFLDPIRNDPRFVDLTRRLKL